MFGRKNQDDGTIVGLIAAGLRRDISFGILTPGSRLKIEQLRESYSGSAHSLREALNQLTAEGLVEAMAQKGFRVASATEADLQDITRLRREVECLGLAWAMERGDVAWEGRLVAARHALGRIEALLESDPLEVALDWEAANKAFHATLIEASGSPRLLAFHDRLYDQSTRFRLAALREGRLDLPASRREHDAIVAAVLGHRTLEAQELLKTHISDGRGRP